MLVLAVDTSAARGSLALAEISDQSPQVLSSREWEKKAMHSDVATLELQGLLEDAGQQLEDISHILINHGPGSFTGLRVGINLARTLAYSLNLPILPIGTLELLAFQNSSADEVSAIAVKALQNFVYAAVYKNDGGKMIEVSAPTSIEIENLERFSGNADKVLVDQSLRLEVGRVQTIDPLTKAQTLVEYFAKSKQKFTFLSWKGVEPLYIRASEPEEKMRRGLLKPV